ncbi:hypothetical protein [Methylobacterium nigriterrae]|uniref:hypothetical protein n=1 Tax=Methylobacterium nigriterrae TaxID=3127512 RepID=UPI00301391E1
MKKVLVVAASLALLSGAAFAQGNTPYNSAGSQAGGPRGGIEREMGARGGTPEMAPGQSARWMGTRRHRHHKKGHRKHHGGM